MKGGWLCKGKCARGRLCEGERARGCLCKGGVWKGGRVCKEEAHTEGERAKGSACAKERSRVNNTCARGWELCERPRARATGVEKGGGKDCVPCKSLVQNLPVRPPRAKPTCKTFTPPSCARLSCKPSCKAQLHNPSATSSCNAFLCNPLVQTLVQTTPA